MERVTRLNWGTSFALLFLLICGTVRPALSAVVYVSESAPGAVHDGKAWSTAFTSVQPAIDAAQSGDEVWVAAAIFAERITLKGGVPLYGGFSGSESSRTQRDWSANVTILDGGGSTTADVVSSTGQDAVIDGFTVRNGRYGVSVVDSPATVTNCTLSGNKSGVYVQWTIANVINCVIRGNTDGVTADTMGGATVAGCVISGNSSGVRVVEMSSAYVSECTITGNGVGINGPATVTDSEISGNRGGVYSIGTMGPTITNCTLSGNVAHGVKVVIATGAITNCTISGSIVGVDGQAVMTNCTISGNGTGINFDDTIAAGAPAAIYNSIIAFNGTGIVNNSYNGGPVTLSHNDVYANPRANYANLSDPTGTNGNISQDPKLSNIYRAVHIQPGSPCINAGDDSRVMAGSTDVDGQPRILGAHVDIGSDESNGTTWPKNPARRWYVASTGDDANAGTSWQSARKTVGGGLSAAQGTDEVWVARGTYAETVTIPPGVSLYGGFAGTEGALVQRNWNANLTTLDGGGSTTANVVTSSVYGAILDGFTVRNAKYGVYVDYGSVTIANCAISGNSSDGVYLGSAAATISNCTVTGNAANGIDASGTAVITNSMFASNNRGVLARFGTADVTNCTISGNVIGVYLASGAVTIANSVVAHNGTGVHRNSDSLFPAMSHNDVYGNAPNFANIPDPAGTNGNISAEPSFVSRTNGDFRLNADSPCIDAGNDSSVVAGTTDLDGRPRIRGAHVDMGAYEFRSLTPWAVSLGTAVGGGVTVADSVAYVAGNDGRLYARSTEDGSAESGFPVDISAVVGATVKLPSRPAIYFGKTGKAIYLTTDRGDVLRILPSGEVAWHVRPLPGQTVSTPAVTPDGEVFVTLSTGAGPFDNYLFKLDEITGSSLTLSPFLGYTNTGDLGDYSPAAKNQYLYVNSAWGSGGGLTLLNQDNLAVRSSFAGGEQCLSPLLVGSDLILATRGGKVYKMNAVTMNPDLGFGQFGVADIGSQISAAPFADAAGNVYLGAADGRILKWSAGTPGFQLLTTASGRIASLTVNRVAGVLAFGTSSGSFVQVPLAQPGSATTASPGGPISTGTVYEALTDRFIVVTDTGVLSSYPSVR